MFRNDGNGTTTETKQNKHSNNESNWYLIWNMIHPCIYICTPDLELTSVKIGPLLRFPCFPFHDFDKFARKIIITIPFFRSVPKWISISGVHRVRDEMREASREAHMVCLKIVGNVRSIHFHGRYYIDYIFMHSTRWKIGDDDDDIGGGGGSGF